MTSINPLSEAFACLIPGHAGCTREAIGDTGNFLIVHHPTPPADDVREALVAALLPTVYGMQDTAQRLADAVLSAPDIEVRPRGTAAKARKA